ncbi:MAG: ATP-binding protein [Pyrinomonadaceae bacterium]|nr:ATP-binding protein [Pyrinomonadaceae bacterium]
MLHRRTIPVRFPKLYVFKPKPAGDGAGKGRTYLVTEETTELELESRIESIARAAEVAAQVVRRLGLSEEAAYGVDMAVREAVTNAVLHGNRQDAAKKVEVKFHGSPERLEITVRDRGTGFDLNSVPDPTDPQNLLKASGRGILFMRTFMDDVQYSRHPEGGTVVRMTKRK